IPKHLFQGYLNIYNNYFKAPWMPDRTEANPNELNQDDARYGFRCCHLKNIWTAPLPPETELSRQMTTSTTSIDIMGLQAEIGRASCRERVEETVIDDLLNKTEHTTAQNSEGEDTSHNM